MEPCPYEKTDCIQIYLKNMYEFWILRNSSGDREPEWNHVHMRKLIVFIYIYEKCVGILGF